MPKRGNEVLLQWSQLLHLTHDLTGFAQALHHLLALFPPSDRVVAFFEEFVKLLCSVHLFQKLALHLILGPPAAC